MVPIVWHEVLEEVALENLIWQPRGRAEPKIDHVITLLLSTFRWRSSTYRTIKNVIARGEARTLNLKIIQIVLKVLRALLSSVSKQINYIDYSYSRPIAV
jgi:hypothetical protein